MMANCVMCFLRELLNDGNSNRCYNIDESWHAKVKWAILTSCWCEMSLTQNNKYCMISQNNQTHRQRKKNDGCKGLGGVSINI